MSNEPIQGVVLDAMPSQQIAVTENPFERMSLLALETGRVEQMDKLLDLQFKWDAEQARKAFNVAMAAFKSSPVLITKDKENKQYNSMYTTLGNLVNTASEAMAPFGLSADWEIEQSDKEIRVTCVLSHSAGHSKRVSLKAMPDTSGAKNLIQQIKSTVTYLRGATFEAVTGLASSESAGINPSDDGNGHGKPAKQNDDANRKAKHDAAYGRHSESVEFIKDRVGAKDWKAAGDEWRAIPKDDQMDLWLAPTKGGCFTTSERDALRKNLPSANQEAAQ